ncbi:uncharacterized protein LY89DRAFT_686616 [Mollisia scopiformis]|uniref:Uncharacterized protein n=1 Tax=Mollisia scopiformis TaxID=149040 RepID=A0A194X5G8_MOLSC|nr:uncharacterized protein LY89DRAFT_686616 [Mollisia scopiformis]KUJ15057.1 hypothetical protein LY89DRAFT_686616 [Mollisia scopiformis]
MAEPQKKTVSRTRIALVMLATVVFIGVVVLFALLADEVFTIPYLTPVAKFLAMVLSPFIPLIFPIYLGIFLKVCAYPKTNWPGKTRWVAITAMWGFSHTQRAVQNIWKVWGRAFKGNGIESICGLDKCKAAWAEEALTVLVIIAHMRGWSWDNDLFTRWVEGLVKQEKIALENAKRKDSAQQMEKGEVAVEDQIVDSEKSELMAKDGIVLEKEKPLVEIEEEQFDENLRLEI